MLNNFILVFEQLVKYDFHMGRPKLHAREETLKKALHFFWKNGFSGGSTRELGQALEMHPGSIYSSFGSKEKLCLEAIELYWQESGERFQSCLEGTDFFSGFGRYLDGLPSDDLPTSCFLAKTFSSRLGADQKLVDRARELTEATRAQMISRIVQAQEKGEIKSDLDPEAFSALIMAQIMGFRALADSSPPQAILRSVSRDIVELLRLAGAPRQGGGPAS
jgi:AcrR family transcriptional regulator